MIEKKLRVDSEKRELPIHVRQGFPLGIFTSHFSEDTYHFVNWHWHEEVQFIHVLEGTFMFHVADNQIEVTEGNGLFLNANQIHKAQSITPEGKYIFIYFHPNLLTDQRSDYIKRNFVTPILSDDFVGSIPLNKNIAEDKRILDKVLEMKKIHDIGSKYFELDLLSCIFQLWKNLLITSENKSPLYSSQDVIANERLKKIVTYIDEHYGSQITLEDIAKHVHLSRSECCRFFKKCVGQSLFQYILNYRINRSIELLLQTNKNIATIAHEVGFNSQSYYTKCFHELKNKKPTTLRKEYKNKTLEKAYLNQIDLE